MEVGTVNVCRVPVPVSGASDMQLEVPYIIFFLVPVFGADFWCVCHWH